MRFSFAIAALLSTAQAHINGISVPSTIKPGDTFNVIILSSNWIQSSYDVAIAFGYATGKGFPGSLGTVADSFYLGPGMLNPAPPLSNMLTVRV